MNSPGSTEKRKGWGIVVVPTSEVSNLSEIAAQGRLSHNWPAVVRHRCPWQAIGIQRGRAAGSLHGLGSEKEVTSTRRLKAERVLNYEEPKPRPDAWHRIS